MNAMHVGILVYHHITATATATDVFVCTTYMYT
jgi:hypothetical protein